MGVTCAVPASRPAWRVGSCVAEPTRTRQRLTWLRAVRRQSPCCGGVERATCGDAPAD